MQCTITTPFLYFCCLVSGCSNLINIRGHNSMLRSEVVDRIALYFGGDDLRGTLEQLGDSALVHLCGAAERDNAGGKGTSEDLKAIELLEQRLSYFREGIELAYEEEYDKSVSFKDAQAAIDKYYEQLVELRRILKSNASLEREAEASSVLATVSQRYWQAALPGESGRISFDFVAGLVDREQKLLVRKTLKGRLRRNVFIKTVDVGLAGAGGRKVAVIAYAPNADAIRVARESIAALGGHVLQEAKPGQAEEYRKEYRRLRRMNLATEQQISSFFKRVTGAYKSWVYAVNRERQLLTAMGVLTAHEGASCVTGEGWVRRRDIPSLEALARKIKGSGRLAFEVTKSEEAHPTCFDTPKVAEAFQGFTDVFGVPKYREINPALFLMFTFPFMFGAMFGDILHGFILGAIAALMIRRFERLNHRCGVLQVILEGRYVMLLCALTSVWFGLLYGDFGSLPVTLFSGRYGPGHAYPFGIDPVWHHAANKTVFINNLKMKLSLVLGFVHMSIGSAIAVLNALHFKDKITLVCTAIPQFIVFTLFLGYLVFLCVYKWLVTRNYPSLVNTLINMYTAPFNIPQQMYPGQLYVQLLILSIILICVPWMFFSKPVFLILRRRIPQEGMLDLWITSGIHVVEFGLSLISNTSSYLRLWAVSLAHVQLTAVLHQFTIGSSSWIVAVCLFPVYAACTILLLIGLEGLSACLHALRLNWIEFFSKFYAGGGTKFAPFSFGLDYEALYEQ